MRSLLLKELQDALRNRWLLGYAVLLALLGLLAAWIAVGSATGFSLQVFGRTTATLMNLCLLLAPLIALSLGAGAIAGEADRGTLERLLAQPIARWELLLGKYLGLFVALLAATFVGFLPAGVVLAFATGASMLAHYLLFPLLASVLIAAMLGVGMWISVISRSAPQAQSLAIFAWFLLVLLYDLLLLGTLSLAGLPTGALATLLVLNPVDSARVLTILALEPDLYLLGPAGALLMTSLGAAGTAAVLAGSLVLWALLPLAAALRRFRLPRHPHSQPVTEPDPPLNLATTRSAVMRSTCLLLATGILLALATACGPAGTDGTPAATADAEPEAKVVTAAMIEHGQEIYIANCAPCHGAQGRGDGPSAANLDPKPRDHTNREYMSTLTDEELGKTIRLGGVVSGMPQMPSHPHINGEDLDDLVAFVRSLSEPEMVAGLGG